MFRYLVLFSCFFGYNSLKSQNLYFPPLSGNEWETMSPATLGWCPDSLQSLIDYVGANNSKAFLILKDGKIVTENYYGTFTADSLWYWASAGKSLTAFLVGMAQQEGLLNINNPTSDYLQQGWTVAPAEKEALITVRNQLTMTTGLDDGVENSDCTDPACLQYLADAGTRWAYHNGPYTLLDKVILSASGLNVSQFYASRVKPRIGAGVSTYIPLDNNNIMFSNARTFARFGLLILNKGVWAQDSLMRDQQYFESMVNTSQQLNKSYGYLWWLNGKDSFHYPGTQTEFPGPLMAAAPSQMIAALGKNGQYLNVVPEMNIVLVRMGNSPEGAAGTVPIILNNEIWKRLNRMNCDPLGEKPEKSYNLKVYPNPASTNFTIDVGKEIDVISVVISDIAGKKLLTENQKTIDTRILSNGIYFLTIQLSNGNVFNEKLVVRK